MTELIEAIRTRNNIAIKLIAECNDINAQDKDSWTILHYACWHDNKEIVTLLLEKGANIDIEDDHGWTALDVAYRDNHKEIVKLLEKHGAK
jgi:ankyrin repeat protein